jgi:hypothetical protein
MKNIFVTLFCIFQFGKNISSQNTILLFVDSTHNGNYITEGNDAEGMVGNSLVKPLRHTIAPIPKEVKEKIPVKIDYGKGLDNLLSSFQTEHLSYHEILPAYSIFGLGNYYVFSALPSESEKEDSASFAKIKQTVFQKNGLLEMIYNWAIPYYKNAFADMSVPEQDDYLTLLNETKLYAENFDLKKETTDLIAMQDGFANTKGKLKAFVFRRIHNKELTKEECIAWVSKIISDLSSVKKQHPTAADNYVLYKELYADYFLAAEYQCVTGFRKRSIVIHRKGNVSEVIDSYFSNINYEGYDIIAGEDDRADTTAIWYKLFYCDTNGYKILTLNKPLYGIGDVLLGEGNERRILIMQKASQDMSQMSCSIIDFDSSFFVAEHVLLPVSPFEDPNSGEVNYMFMFFGNDFIFQDDNSKLYGIMNRNGKIIYPAKYKSIKAGKKDGQFILDKKKITLTE